MLILQLLINKILYILFFISFLIIFRQGYLFIRNLIDEEPKKIILTNKEMVYICVSLAILLASIFKGIGI
jgi:hypothetical protein